MLLMGVGCPNGVVQTSKSIDPPDSESPVGVMDADADRCGWPGLAKKSRVAVTVTVGLGGVGLVVGMMVSESPELRVVALLWVIDQASAQLMANTGTGSSRSAVTTPPRVCRHDRLAAGR